MPTVAEVIKRLVGCGNEHVAVAIWCETDVREYAKELGVELTLKQIRDILDDIDMEQDCSEGITWDTLEYYIREYQIEQRIVA